MRHPSSRLPSFIVAIPSPQINRFDRQHSSSSRFYFPAEIVSYRQMEIRGGCTFVGPQRGTQTVGLQIASGFKKNSNGQITDQINWISAANTAANPTANAVATEICAEDAAARGTALIATEMITSVPLLGGAVNRSDRLD
jgi:hypothetical protein